MRLLDKIVKEMLEEHVGGEKFFDNLDKKMQEHTIVSQLYCLYPVGANVIVSGKFGMFYSTTMPNSNMLIVNGGLRKGEPITDLSYAYHRIKGRNFIFVDDSFYSGKTRNAVRAEIEKHGGKLVATYVIYDGSVEKDNTVHSLYRYYDHHQKPVEIKEEIIVNKQQTTLTINQVMDIFAGKISRSTINAMIYTEVIKAHKSEMKRNLWLIPMSELEIIQKVIDEGTAAGVQQKYQEQLAARKPQETTIVASKPTSAPICTTVEVKPATAAPSADLDHVAKYANKQLMNLSNIMLQVRKDAYGVYEVLKHRGTDGIINAGTKFVSSTIAETLLAKSPRVTIIDADSKLIAKNWM